MDIETFIGKHINTKTDVTDIFSRTLSLAKYKTKSKGKQNDEGYDFTNEFMGMAVVISNGSFEANKNRAYCEDEIKMMKEIFGPTGLNFTVVAFQNLTAEQMHWVLDEAVKQTEFHQKSDCFVCIIGSHGSENPRALGSSDTGFRDHCLYGTDDIPIFTKNVINKFSDVETLETKPKLFFIQACRSTTTKEMEDKIDIGHDVILDNTIKDPSGEKQNTNVGKDQEDIKDGAEGEDIQEGKIWEGLKSIVGFSKNKSERKDVIRVVYPPCKDDCVVIYASSSGKQAYGRDGEGGWMLKRLHIVMQKHLESLEKNEMLQIDLMNVLIEMSQLVSNMETKLGEGVEYPKRKSTMSFEHCLHKGIYFT